MKEIGGKTALVTGAASGIGQALALRLAAEGANLYLIDVDQVGLEQVVLAARSLGVDAIGRRCDLTQSQQIAKAASDVRFRLGGVDLLVNNAGVTYYGRTAEMSAENWDRLLAVNLLAPIQLTRELLPSMLERGDAHVVNVASICGLVGLGRVTAYSTSKFGLVGFSESLRAEYGRRGLGVTALCPGFVDTKLFSSAAAAPDQGEKKIPPRFLLATPERIANRAIRAIYRNHGVVVIQPYARMLYLAKRLFPGALDRLHRLSRRRGAAPANASRDVARPMRNAAA